MVSATTADSRLSTAAKMATVRAEGRRGRIRSGRKEGKSIRGRPEGMPPNFEPMVSTGRFRTAATPVAATTATMEPGSRGTIFGVNRITASEADARAYEGRWMLEACVISVAILA